MRTWNDRLDIAFDFAEGLLRDEPLGDHRLRLALKELLGAIRERRPGKSIPNSSLGIPSLDSWLRFDTEDGFVPTKLLLKDYRAYCSAACMSACTSDVFYRALRTLQKRGVIRKGRNKYGPEKKKSRQGWYGLKLGG